MQMMSCPHCGASNSVKRALCFECERPLKAGSEQPRAADREGEAVVTTCADCCYASPAPPLGQRMTHEQVWCSRRDAPVSATQVAGDCYEPAFTWSRDQIID